MVFCTAHFVISHILEIVMSIACAWESSSDNEPEINEPCPAFTDKIKGMFYNCSLMPSESVNGQSTYSSPVATSRRSVNTRSDIRSVD
ncbi:hypothetical protein HCN44_004315 [Aphidius gifuensis]|uniref:Odorant-binding protein n=2 Tax=Aphidius gifuensis TaxID=684658 RepID=A0A834XWJ9_APHGI|nr:hypothetical protein HCN44_004315 [Aphidius gifuensis]